MHHLGLPTAMFYGTSAIVLGVVRRAGSIGVSDIARQCGLCCAEVETILRELRSEGRVTRTSTPGAGDTWSVPS